MSVVFREFNQYDNSADASVPQSFPKKHKFGANADDENESPPAKKLKVQEVQEENGHEVAEAEGQFINVIQLIFSIVFDLTICFFFSRNS